MLNGNLTPEQQKLLALALAQRGIDRRPEAPIVAQGRPGECVQSFAQQRLWFLEKLNPGTPVYNIPWVVRIASRLDHAALQRSLDEILRRHDVLRARFIDDGDQPKQIFAPELALRIPVTDLAHLGEAEQRNAIDQAVAANASTPFDLASGPLLRLSLIDCGERGQVLLFCVHHIVADAWSIRIFMNELNALYAAHLRGESSPLAEPALQYSDYALWQQRHLEGPLLDEQLGYWRRQLGGELPVLDLPVDRPRHARRSTAGSSLGADLPADLCARLRAFAADNGSTLFMVCLAGFKALLGRYCGQTDIIVGTPVWNRNRSEFESLIGFFINTLALRTDLSGDPTFAALAAAVRETALGAFSHEDVPFEKVVESLGLPRVSGEVPLIRAMFSLATDEPPATAADAGVQMTVIDPALSTAKFDLTMLIIERGEQLRVELQYSTDLFDASTIERMIGHFRTLLSAATLAPQTRLSRLPLLPEAERGMLAAWSRGAEAAAAADVVAQIDAQVRARGDALAIAEGERRLTYAELGERAGRVAAALRRSGVARGDVVAVAMERSLEMAVAMLAIWKAGAAYLPLDLRNPVERQAFIVRDAGVAIVLGRSGDAFAVDGVQRLDIDALDGGEGLDEVPAGNDLAYVIYTSGSTGQPKGVEITQASLANLVGWQQRTFAITGHDRASQLAGAAFDASVLEWWAPLTMGASVHIVDEATRAQPALLVQWYRQHAITLSFVPTPLAEALLEERWPEGTTLRAMLTGGDTLHRWPPAGLPFALYNNYGPTEGTVIATSVLLAATGAIGRPPIGRPIDGVTVKVLDEARQPVPVGVVGELYIGGAGLARGYRGNAALTAERFVRDDAGERLYRSGDRVRHLADGQIQFLGRLDDQVKIRGYRIELGEIEAALAALPAVKQALVDVQTFASGDRRLNAYVVLHAEAAEATLPEHLLAGLRTRLPDYMVPASVFLLDALPTTANGKIDRRALPTLAGEHVDAHEDTVLPRDEIETALAEIWEEVLNYRPVGINHNFFKHGGHSLNALSLRLRIYTRFGVEIDLMTLFEHGTIEHLAEHVRELVARGAANDGERPAWAEEDAAAEAPRGLVRRIAQRLGLGRGSAPRRLSVNQQLALKSLVPLQRGGSAAPLFCVHPVSGGVACYAELGRVLGTARPVYALENAKAWSDQSLSIEEMAARYGVALRSVQPKGPYALCGWSLGGVIAFEIARQLRAAGEEVSMLMLLDSYLFDPHRDRDDLTDAEMLDSFVKDLVLSHGLTPTAEWLANVDLGPDPDPVAQSLVALKTLSVLPQDCGLDQFRAQLKAYARNFQAWAGYRPGEYGGRVQLTMCADSIESGERSPMKSWGRVAVGGLSLDVLACSHYALLRAPMLDAVASRLSTLLAAGADARRLEK
jgi:amino acid adenylation domain-containing protein